MRQLVFSIFLTLSLMVNAAPIDEAKQLYRAGRYDAAMAQLTAILKTSPANAPANYYMGMCMLRTGDQEQGLKHLRKAEDKGSIDAAKQLASMAIDEYWFDEAEEHIATWEKLLKKERKTDDATTLMRDRMALLSGMLSNVEKIAIIDSLNVDSAEFFKHYKLSGEAGIIYEGAFLPPAYTDSMPRMVYMPQSRTELFWASPDGNGKLQLVSAQILDDGSVQPPVPMGSILSEEGDADFPFFMPDGVTFYYANNDKNSIGGYDIFLSRRQADGRVFEPQNVGMPYNSPYDDYMLAIDEVTGLGWWATNRTQIPGKVTIYVFLPNDTRINYDADDPDIADYALVRDIGATYDDTEVDVDKLLSNPLLHSSQSAEEATAEFWLPMGKGAVYTRLSQFKHAKARQAMQQYLAREQDYKDMKTKLVAMRQGYANGDKAVGPEILSMEKRLISAEQLLRRLRNQVVEFETL